MSGQAQCSTCGYGLDKYGHCNQCQLDNEITLGAYGDPSVGIPASGVRISGDLPDYDDLVSDGTLEEVRQELERAIGDALFGERVRATWGREDRLVSEAEAEFHQQQQTESEFRLDVSMAQERMLRREHKP